MSTFSAMYAIQCMCCAIHALLSDWSNRSMALAAQTLRGGRVKLQSIMVPETEYTHQEKVRSRKAFYQKCFIPGIPPRVPEQAPASIT